MVRVLVLGGSGLVGKALINGLIKSNNYDVYGTYYTNEIDYNGCKSIKLDIKNELGFINTLNKVKPEIIISCLRGDFRRQSSIHRIAGDYLRSTKGRMLFCSTANVFDNDLSKTHDEFDKTNTSTDYGEYKLNMENMLAEVLGDRLTILRLPHVWGRDSIRLNQLKKSLDNNETVLVYPNLYVSGICDSNLADKIIFIMDNDLYGIYHLTSNNVVSHRQLYEELVKGLGYDMRLLKSSTDYSGHFALSSKKRHMFEQKLNQSMEDLIMSLI